MAHHFRREPIVTAARAPRPGSQPMLAPQLAPIPPILGRGPIVPPGAPFRGGALTTTCSGPRAKPWFAPASVKAPAQSSRAIAFLRRKNSVFYVPCCPDDDAAAIRIS
jgi:hypothetical protein